MEEKVIAKFISINKGEGFQNIVVEGLDHKEFSINVSLEQLEQLKILQVYEFTFVSSPNPKSSKNKTIRDMSTFTLIENIYSGDELVTLLDAFFSFLPMSIKSIKEGIEEFLNKIENRVIFKITKGLLKKYEDRFYVYPAANSFHHSYYGGLAYHTFTMLRIAQSYLKEYSYLNQDLLYGGIILHDILKAEEFTGLSGGYSTYGSLVGHLIGGAIEISHMADELGYKNHEEVMLLEHICISHHGIFTFGSQKKPQLPEALLIWYIDSIDAKMRSIEEELQKTDPGSFTGVVPAADRTSFYKPHKPKTTKGKK